MHESRDKIIVFDGVCVLCSGWVNFVLQRDHARQFKFAAMQTSAGRALLSKHGIDPDDPVTFLVVDDSVPYKDTDALIRVLGNFNAGWRILAAGLRCVPRTFRNAVYRWIARNRYRFFGRREACYFPRPDETMRFLD
jgi:predicted DCC family thiol-disulfide oxidoreductase YuxK